MRIGKAIELNKDTKHRQLLRGEVEHAKASQLGIEALKFKHEWDMGRVFENNYLLPGETEE